MSTWLEIVGLKIQKFEKDYEFSPYELETFKSAFAVSCDGSDIQNDIMGFWEWPTKKIREDILVITPYAASKHMRDAIKIHGANYVFYDLEDIQKLASLWNKENELLKTYEATIVIEVIQTQTPYDDDIEDEYYLLGTLDFSKLKDIVKPIS